MNADEAAVWEFARQFARPSGDSPDCECASCRAYRAVQSRVLPPDVPRPPAPTPLPSAAHPGTRTTSPEVTR